MDEDDLYTAPAPAHAGTVVPPAGGAAAAADVRPRHLGYACNAAQVTVGTFKECTVVMRGAAFDQWRDGAASKHLDLDGVTRDDVTLAIKQHEGGEPEIVAILYQPHAAKQLPLGQTELNKLGLYTRPFQVQIRNSVTTWPVPRARAPARQKAPAPAAEPVPAPTPIAPAAPTTTTRAAAPAPPAPAPAPRTAAAPAPAAPRAAAAPNIAANEAGAAAAARPTRFRLLSAEERELSDAESPPQPPRKRYYVMDDATARSVEVVMAAADVLLHGERSYRHLWWPAEAVE